MKNIAIITKSGESKQLITEDMQMSNGTYIIPFFDYQSAFDLFYINTYHRRCILTKSMLLSQIEETDLDRYLPAGTNPKQILNAFVRNLELFGTAYFENAGTPAKKLLFILPSFEGRLDRERHIWQVSPIAGDKKLDDGITMTYYSPRSRYYGEPDYLATMTQMLVEEKIHIYNAAFFDNRATPDMGIIFEGAEPSDEQMAAFRDFFGTAFKGAANAHKTLILSAPPSVSGTDGKPSIRIERLNEITDMSFEKLRIMNREEIIAAHNMPPRLVGVITAGQLGGGGEMIGQLHAFNETELKPKIELLEYWFESHGIKLKLREMDVSTYKDDSDVVQGLVNTGIITPQEAREVMGWK
jgi:capsid portal protein